jgi:hypothetical protein
MTENTLDLERLEADLKTIFDELDMRQLAIYAQQTPLQRLQMMFDLCEFAHNLIIASERQRQPDISDEELSRRVRARIELSYEPQELSRIRKIHY